MLSEKVIFKNLGLLIVDEEHRFGVRQKGERKGRNPKTGEEVPIKPRRVLVFRASNVLKQKINHSLNPGSDNKAPSGAL